jgi:hypothetical protein
LNKCVIPFFLTYFLSNTSEFAWDENPDESSSIL